MNIIILIEALSLFDKLMRKSELSVKEELSALNDQDKVELIKIVSICAGRINSLTMNVLSINYYAQNNRKELESNHKKIEKIYQDSLEIDKISREMFFRALRGELNEKEKKSYQKILLVRTLKSLNKKEKFDSKQDINRFIKYFQKCENIEILYALLSEPDKMAVKKIHLNIKSKIRSASDSAARLIDGKCRL